VDRAARAIEENGEEFLLAMGRAGGGEERDDGAVRWTIGGSPVSYHNAVVAAALGDEDADGVIQESVEQLRAHGVPGTWHVGPSMRPSDIADRLLGHGFRLDGEEIGMALDPTATVTVPTPERVTIDRVLDRPDLDAYRSVLARGFGEGPAEATWVKEVFEAIGHAEDSPWRHFVALQGDEPVGTSTLFLHQDVGGIYFVCTVPDARRRGVGAAVTLAAVREAEALGCNLVVLGSSPMGYGVYRRLGFEGRCRIGVYASGQT
jgi:ribosomal protein S18 acetylase RimI-like enzyme